MNFAIKETPKELKMWALSAYTNAAIRSVAEGLSN